MQCPFRDLHRGRGLPGIPLLSQEPRSSPGRYPGDRAGPAAAADGRHGRCTGDLVRGENMRRRIRAKHARRWLDRERPGAGRALLPHPPGRWARGAPGCLCSGCHAGPRAPGRGKYPALRPRLRVVGAGSGPCRPQWLDRRARDPRLFPRRKGRLRPPGATGPRRSPSHDYGGGAGFFVRSGTADHVGRHRSNQYAPRSARPDCPSRHRSR